MEPDNVPIPRPEYPRPILSRTEWLNLNGDWRYAADPGGVGLTANWPRDGLPERDSRVIVVPYPIESAASKIHDRNPPAINWYQRDVDIPADWKDVVLLRIGACDYATSVYVNGHEVGQHTGGYAPSAFDISHALAPGSNRITIRVWDGDSWTQPRGKQAGTTKWPIDYDAVTGIWQTVWLEPLPATWVESTHSIFSMEDGRLTFSAFFNRQVRGTLAVRLSLDGVDVAEATVDTVGRAEAKVTLQVTDPQYWSPERPTLYDVALELHDHDHATLDTANSYVGLRTVSVRNGELHLNDRPLYVRGVLDQGYFPEGWYTALNDDDIRADIELTLQMGLNCARKHQKAEDPRYLYWADKLGLLVWVEMPSGRVYSSELVNALTVQWMALVQRDRGHPSVITWVPFNESWGVWNQSTRPEQRAFVDALVSMTHALDPSRPVVGNDGWEYSSGDLWTLHLYDDGSHNIKERLDALIKDPSLPVTGDSGRRHPRIGALPGADVTGLPIVLSECGGVGFGKFSDDDFSYGDLPTTTEELEKEILVLMTAIEHAERLQGFVWTQLTDIQQEVNGLLYFDRTPKLPLSTYRRLFRGTG